MEKVATEDQTESPAPDTAVPPASSPVEVAPPPSPVEALFAEIAAGYGGKQRFVVSGKVFEIDIPADADSHTSLYETMRQFGQLKPEHAPDWRAWLPISSGVANRIAYAKICKTSIRAEGQSVPLSDGDLLRLAKEAGGIFNAVTDEIMGRCQSTVSAAEIELTEQLGNVSPPASGGAS